MNMLQDLLRKIRIEMARLVPLTAGSANLTAKYNILMAMEAMIQSYVDDIVNNRIAIHNVPIKPEDATAFLAMDLETRETVPELVGGPSAAIMSPTASGGSGGGSSTSKSTGSDIQSIFAQIQDMKWRMEINYDPTFNQQKELLDRLENLERRIMSYISSGVSIPPDVRLLFMREITLIGNIIAKMSGTQEFSNPPPLNRGPPIQSSRVPTSPQQGAGVRDTSRVHSVFGGDDHKQTATANYNEDAAIRPGFVMNDYQIQHRGSASAFQTSAVGGLDYKKRSQDICRQIKSAGLGDPKDFGCIDPSAVSATYSWRGNFNMVCDRLNDTWGHWYPEMFGCLPSNKQ